MDKHGTTTRLFPWQVICSVSLLLFSSGAISKDETVSLNLDKIGLVDLVKIVYGDAMQNGYVLDSELIKHPQQYTLDLKYLTNQDLKALADKLLNEQGFQVDNEKKFFRIKKAGQGTDQPFYYRPKHRSVNYLTEILQGVFKGKFTYQAAPVKMSGEMPSPDQEHSKTSATGLQQQHQDAFIFLGSPQEVDQLQTMLKQIDTPSPEVMVKAYLYEVATTEKEGSGFNAAINILQGKFGINIQGANLANSINVTLPNIQAAFSALDSDSRFKLISAPSLRVKDGTQAVFSVGAEVPVLGAVTTPQSGQAVQSVEYRSSGTILDIKPTIREEGIELVVNQQLSGFVQTTTGVNNSPTLTKRELKSTVTAKDGDLILMGGLDETRSSQTASGLSWLPALFHTLTGESNKTDVLLVLHVQKL